MDAFVCVRCCPKGDVFQTRMVQSRSVRTSTIIAAYKVGTNLTNGILYRNLGYMNMTQNITIIDDMIGNNAFFIQDYTPLYCPKDVPPNNGNGCYHNSNVFNYDAPSGVKKTWPDLYKHFV